MRTKQIRVVVTPNRGFALPNFQRHFDTLEFLEAERPEGKFMVCDCRDLVLLGDPFTPLTWGHRLHVFQECGLYRNRDEFYNQAWLEALGPTTLDRLGDHIPLCGGTIMSESLRPLLAYHRAHVSVVNKYLTTVVELDRFNDQATFNDTIRSGLPETEIIVHTNEMPSLVYTMGTVPPEEYSITNGRIWVNGFCPPVIHQYDRRDRAYGLVRERFTHWPGFPN